MSQGVQNFYNACRECKFAEFLDFETLRCGKGVVYEANKDCEEFESFYEKTGKDRGQLLEIADEVDEILELEEEEVINELKKVESPEVVNIQGMEPTEADLASAPVERVFSVHTKKKCYVYSNPKARSEHLLRTEPPNKLIPFHRVVIRNGEEFIMLKEPNGDKAYIAYDRLNLEMCTLAFAKKNPLDILLMPHLLFDASTDSTKFTANLVKDSFAEYVNSTIETKRGVTNVSIKSIFKQEGREMTSMNSLSFNRQVSDLKIGRLNPNATFYIIEDKLDNHARKIKLSDGTEAILMNHPEAYQVEQTNLDEFVDLVSKIVIFGIIILGIGIVLIETGWLVFIGILVIPIALIVGIFFSLPLHFVLSQIIKRL